MNDQDVVINPTEVGLSTEDEMEQMKKKRRCWSFFFVLLLDVTVSVVLMTSFIPKISQREGTSQHFTFSGSVFLLRGLLGVNLPRRVIRLIWRITIFHFYLVSCGFFLFVVAANAGAPLKTEFIVIWIFLNLGITSRPQTALYATSSTG